MKKTGFTIAELIVTLGIVGVVAALTAPAVTNLMPDQNKIRVIEYNTELTNAINDILSDESLFRQRTVIGANGEPELSCTGLACVNNFRAELEQKLSVVNGRYKNFAWVFNDFGDGSYRTLLYTNNEPTSRPYMGRNPNDVNCFFFNIDANGAVLPGDSLTEAYLKNPLKMNDREKDFAEAKRLYQEANGNGGVIGRF